MSVAFVYDSGNADGSVGGAELTMREFAAAAPEPLVEMDEAETVVVGNCVSFGSALIEQFRGKRVLRYWHDLAKHEDPQLRAWLIVNATHIFTSPLHLKLHEISGVWPVVPPALDLDRFRPNRELRRNGHRKGACAIAAWMNPGKGGNLVGEVASELGGVDCYGAGPFKPISEYVADCGELSYDNIPETLWRYQTFVHLPWAVEPFGRAVVEAWAAGCEVITNDLVGARYWIEENPEGLRTAAEDFWRAVLL